MPLLGLGRCILQLIGLGSRPVIRFLLFHKGQHVLGAAREDDCFQRAKAELLIAGIPQHRHQVPDQMDQEIAIAAGAKGCLFGSTPVAGNQSLDNSAS